MNDLRTVRKAKGLKQYELAERAGITPVELSNIERGKVFPNRDTREKLEKVLDCKLDFVGAKVILRSANYQEAVELIKRAVEIRLLLPVQEQRELNKLASKYFKIN